MNKKNLLLKNISYMSPLSQSKSNISPILGETQRMIITSGNKGNHNHTNSHSHITQYINKDNQNELYRNTSSGHSTNTSSFGILTNGQIVAGNNHIKLNCGINKKGGNINDKSNNKRNLFYYNYSTSNNNVLKCSTSSSFSQNNNNQQSQNRNNKTNLYPHSPTNNSVNKYPRNNNGNNNISSHMKTKSNLSYSDNQFPNNNYNHNNTFLRQQFSPSSESSVSNNIKPIYNEYSKRAKSKLTSPTKNLPSFSATNSKSPTSKDFGLICNGKLKSLYTSKNKYSIISENYHFKNINEINTPEELHFFYVNILQTGKLVENKFEINE